MLNIDARNKHAVTAFSVPRQTDWQLIETAPKDELILGWITSAEWDVGDGVISMREAYRPFPAAVSWLGREWRLLEEFGFYMELQVSHWMSLQGPPDG